MSKHTIALKRASTQGLLATNKLSTDAFTAIMSIEAIEDAEIVSETADRIEISYSMNSALFWQTDEYLLQFGLARASVK